MLDTNNNVNTTDITKIFDDANRMYFQILTNEEDDVTKLHYEFEKWIDTIYSQGYTIVPINDEFIIGLYKNYISAIDSKLEAVKLNLYERAHSLRTEELRLRQCLSEIVYFTLDKSNEKIIKFINPIEIE